MISEIVKSIPIVSQILLAENAGMTFLDALPILKNGILACLLASVVSAFLGIYVLVRRMVFVSAALSQVSALGVAFAFLGGSLLGLDLGEGIHHTMPLIFAGLAASFLAVQTSEKKITRESLLGIGYVLPAGLVLLILDKMAGETHEIDNILFGNTVFVPTGLLIFLLLTVIAVLLIHLIFYKEFVFVAFDPDSARAGGLSTVLYNQIFFLTVAVTISVSISAIGALPVFGFMVMPAAAALMLTDYLKRAFLLSIGFGAASALIGFYLSFLYSLPTGPAMLATCAVWLIPGTLQRIVKR
jgi:zinc transport system permease protein